MISCCVNASKRTRNGEIRITVFEVTTTMPGVFDVITNNIEFEARSLMNYLVDCRSLQPFNKSIRDAMAHY